jgi:hypothetical protein
MQDFHHTGIQPVTGIRIPGVDCLESLPGFNFPDMYSKLDKLCSKDFKETTPPSCDIF